MYNRQQLHFFSYTRLLSGEESCFRRVFTQHLAFIFNTRVGIVQQGEADVSLVSGEQSLVAINCLVKQENYAKRCFNRSDRVH